jgi:hypothetical protein
MFPLKPGMVTGPKKSKPVLKQTHTQFTKFGMGNNYGRSSKNPMGRVRDPSGTVGYRPVSKRQLGKPPKSVV